MGFCCRGGAAFELLTRDVLSHAAAISVRQFWWSNCAKMAKAFGITLSEPLPPVDVQLRTCRAARSEGSAVQLKLCTERKSFRRDSHAGGGETIDCVTGVVGQCIHTPGHTRGSTCYYFPAFKLLFTGDTLFKYDRLSCQ